MDPPDAIVSPRSVAVIGAVGAPAKVGHDTGMIKKTTVDVLPDMMIHHPGVMESDLNPLLFCPQGRETTVAGGRLTPEGPVRLTERR